MKFNQRLQNVEASDDYEVGFFCQGIVTWMKILLCLIKLH